MPLILRQAVGDIEPWRFGADKNVCGWADGGIIAQRSHGDMDPRAIADQGIQQRTTSRAVRIVAFFVAEDHALILTFGDRELFAFDAGERLERGAGRAPAVRAMAVQGVSELVHYRIIKP